VKFHLAAIAALIPSLSALRAEGSEVGFRKVELNPTQK
jgi:hypothetical protein